MSEAPQESSFPIKEAREIVKDLLPPRPFVYWADFLFHSCLGWGTFYLAVHSEGHSFYRFVFFLISSFALFRAAIFIHELTHLRKNTFNVFHVIWNVLCGFPLMIPSFLYQGVHNDHHKRSIYGTEKDGEYFPFVAEGRKKIIVFVFSSFLVPIFFFIRFAFLTPISRLNEKLRSTVLERASSFSININYRRTRSSLASASLWQVQETVACLYGWTFLAMVIQGIWPAASLALWYLVATTLFLTNSLRTLVAHCYRNVGSNTLDFSEQLLDSVNVPGNLFAPLWAPVGLRFHATHHLIPEIPYHSLRKAHRRLSERFSEKDLYNKTSGTGLCSELGRLWREAG